MLNDWPEPVDNILANTLRNKNVIMTSKRRFDVIITFVLRCVFAGMMSEWVGD